MKNPYTYKVLYATEDNLNVWNLQAPATASADGIVRMTIGGQEGISKIPVFPAELDEDFDEFSGFFPYRRRGAGTARRSRPLEPVSIESSPTKASK